MNRHFADRIGVGQLKPSAHSTIFVTEDEDFCRWRRKLAVCGKHMRFLSLTTIFNIKHARHSFSSLTTEDKISVASDKNLGVCARL